MVIGQENIKYSIIIPFRNGSKYLPSCVNTIINQKFDNYELIISNNYSNDNVEIYLNAISHPRVKIIHSPKYLSMAEHWEWALSKSSGEWVIFVGQDDGLQSYFFSLAEYLTSYAEKIKIKIIMSERAYFFWPGCEYLYGNSAVSYNAKSKLKVLNSKYQLFLALLGFQTYFDLPQMYTTSLFKRQVIEKAKKLQEGKLFLTHPQDANLAAIGCSLEDKYLKSYIPLGWVGSSPKSAGMAIMLNSSQDDEFDAVRNDYIQKTEDSDLKMSPLTGNFSLGSCPIYLWGAMLQTKHLRKMWLNKLILSKIFRTIVFGGVLFEINSSKKLDVNFRRQILRDIITINQCNFVSVTIFSKIMPILYKFKSLLDKFYNFIDKYIITSSLSYNIKWGIYPEINLNTASERVESLLEKSKLIEKLITKEVKTKRKR